MSPAFDTIVIKAPAGTKARWVRQSQREGRKLSDWLISRIEARAVNVYKIPDSLANKYHGTGHAMVAVTGGQVVDLVYLADALPNFDPDAPDALAAGVADDRLGPTVRHLQALGRVSVCLLSCWEAVEL